MLQHETGRDWELTNTCQQLETLQCVLQGERRSRFRPCTSEASVKSQRSRCRPLLERQEQNPVQNICWRASKLSHKHLIHPAPKQLCASPISQARKGGTRREIKLPALQGTRTWLQPRSWKPLPLVPCQHQEISLPQASLSGCLFNTSRRPAHIVHYFLQISPKTE